MVDISYQCFKTDECILLNDAEWISKLGAPNYSVEVQDLKCVRNLGGKTSCPIRKTIQESTCQYFQNCMLMKISLRQLR